MCNKRTVSGKKFIATASVVFPVGVTNNQNKISDKMRITDSCSNDCSLFC